ncbi:hypothetical protein [Methylobacterium gnaphalii]|uniref:hypothetical protein n=1 Tax=Methylobacterium gnaphalii TaxID=1010610 RepID=UPI0014786E3D|nr:hypothetical protein [Methylobacterium gnaphalii]
MQHLPDGQREVDGHVTRFVVTELSANSKTGDTIARSGLGSKDSPEDPVMAG